MSALYVILLILAVVCFVMAVFGKAFRNYNLVAAGLLFWVMVPLFQTLDRHLS